jgi:hypothetical protein
MESLKKGSFLLILIALAILFIPAAVFAQDVIAYIGEVGGTVTVTRENPGEEIAAKIGMLLQEGDTVKTEGASYSSIIFQDDGSRVKLGENAQITLNAVRQKKKLNKRMFLSGGKLWAKVSKKKGTDFQVQTPTSVASVKGTRFIMEEKASGETWLWVTEDSVRLDSDGGGGDVGEGQYARTTSDEFESGDITDDTQPPVEPGEHELIIYFELESEGTTLQRELHIEYEGATP